MTFTMRNTWIIFKREMMSYFYSPVAYIVGFCFLSVMGYWFYYLVDRVEPQSSELGPMQYFLAGLVTWFVMLTTIPFLTMRLFSDEKKSGTIESLMTAPLRDGEYVMGKFFAAYALYGILWLLTLNVVLVLSYVGQDSAPIDRGPIVGGYIGLMLLGMLFTSVGCMTSAMTKNQIIAAILCFSACILLFVVGIDPDRFSERYRRILEAVSLLSHLVEFSGGIVDWRRVVFYLSSTGFFLFVTHRIVQSRQWKG
jgi:ABC-2 type transport system permease protein